MNVEAIKKIMSKKTLLTLAVIKVLTGSSDIEARKMRIEALQTYLPIEKNLGLKKKVRIDKFVDYYDNKYLIEMYKSIMTN